MIRNIQELIHQAHVHYYKINGVLVEPNRILMSQEAFMSLIRDMSLGNTVFKQDEPIVHLGMLVRSSLELKGKEMEVYYYKTTPS